MFDVLVAFGHYDTSGARRIDRRVRFPNFSPEKQERDDLIERAKRGEEDYDFIEVWDLFKSV